ncbi:MAG: MobA/MobL family protein [Sphingomonas sp.]|uniref:MobA/MobL family protein n=1 Tax=Sphingomonas sp. TaxID=28214 RepID=UPI0025D39FC9|nr:MobA/MobL family protein [Sphingomonas sp.]MBX3564386.1 MobA/MobL family protein [Sphingomonas sp.]
MAKEERELFGPILRRLHVREPEPAIKRGSAVQVPEWRTPSSGGTRTGGAVDRIDFSRASPISAERRQSDVARVPHLDITHITRTVVPRSSKGKTHRRYPAVGEVAAGHHDYVLDGALSYANHFDYITRQAGGRDPDDPMPVMDLLDFEEEHRAQNVLAVLSNIGVTRQRQRSLFEAAERCERQARSGTLTVSTKHAEAWRTAAAEPNAPSWIKDASRRLDAVETKQVLSAARRKKPVVEKDVALCDVNLEQAYDRLTETDAIFGKRSPALPAFKQGRSGRVQTRFVVELPRNLDPRSYHEIMRRLCGRLDADGWMYVAAIHRPDPHNTPDNMHVHIDAYDRPSRWLDDHSCWDFEYRVKKRNGKWAYPYRQNKIAIARGEAGGPNGLTVASAYYKALRAAYANIANDVIAGRPDTPRYVGGTYRENGIDLTPLRHLGNRTIAAEKRGIVTPAGIRNALIMFGDKLRQVGSDLTAGEKGLGARAATRINAAKATAAQRAVREWKDHEAAALLREAQARVMEIASGLLRSRAEAVIAHQRGDDQPHAKRRQEEAIVADARAWLDEIDAVMPGSRDRDAEAAIVAGHHSAAGAALRKAEDYDRNALPTLSYEPRFGDAVSVNAEYRTVTRGRLFEWLKENEENDEALVIDDHQVSIGAAVPKAIDRLFRLFIADLEVQERLHRERLRRQMTAVIESAGSNLVEPSLDTSVRGPATGADISPAPVSGIRAQAARIVGSPHGGQDKAASKGPRADEDVNRIGPDRDSPER